MNSILFFKNKKFKAVVISCLLGMSLPAWPASTAPDSVFPLCPSILFSQKPPFSLSGDEERLVCGDPKAQDTSSQAWSEISPAQAELALKAMFQIRGYHHPHFENRNGILIVNLGQPSIITAIHLENAPPEIDINRKREVVGAKLVPQKLDELKDWITLELKHRGYPCPHVDIVAGTDTGELLAKVKAGPLLQFTEVHEPAVGDLHPGVLRRYDAFNTGENFDVWDLTLTEKRTVDDYLVNGTHFTETCENEQLNLKQVVEPGLPRLLKVGVGFDTEQGPLFMLSSHYSRLNQRGSSLDLSLSASYRIQEFTSTFNWYVLRNPSRFYLKPLIDIKRDNEPSYTIFTDKVSALPTTSWDDKNNRWDESFGPSFEIDQTLAGQGPNFTQTLFMNENVILTSHDFEYYLTSPQNGYKLTFNSSISNQSLGSTVTASQLALSGEMLFNIGKFSPPSMVFGVRGGYNTTLTPNGGGDLLNLPVPFRYYLGGTKDLRGFSLQEIAGSIGLGSMTEGFLGLESRFLALLPFNLQPFLFIDGGVIGAQPNTFDWPLYWSPGLGLRWASPIGAFRVEAAHGFLDSPSVLLDSSHSHFQFYVSYGEEF